MFKPGRRNPSFFVVTLDTADSATPVERALARAGGNPAGSNLQRISRDRFVLVEQAARALKILERPIDGIDLLGGLRGVVSVGVMPASDLVVFLRNSNAGPRALRGGRDKVDRWNLEMVKAEAAWGMLESQGINWRTTRIGHIDTGYSPHTCFANWGARPTRRQVLVEIGRNLKDPNQTDPADPLLGQAQQGHGTRTMSVIAGHDAAIGFDGTAPGILIVPYRITDSVVIDFAANGVRLGDAIRAAIAPDAGCGAINISLGDPWLPPADVGAAVDEAYEAGVIIVAAAGNITSEVTYPGRYARTITAGGVDRQRRPWAGGSYGPRVTLCAPAKDIVRAEAESTDPRKPGRRYADGGDGTSYAAAHVSGAAGLWLARHGSALDAYRGWRRVEAFRHCLVQSAAVPRGWNHATHGAGILDIAKLLATSLPPADSLQPAFPEAVQEKC